MFVQQGIETMGEAALRPQNFLVTASYHVPGTVSRDYFFSDAYRRARAMRSEIGG